MLAYVIVILLITHQNYFFHHLSMVNLKTLINKNYCCCSWQSTDRKRIFGMGLKVNRINIKIVEEKVNSVFTTIKLILVRRWQQSGTESRRREMTQEKIERERERWRSTDKQPRSDHKALWMKHENMINCRTLGRYESVTFG